MNKKTILYLILVTVVIIILFPKQKATTTLVPNNYLQANRQTSKNLIVGAGITNNESNNFAESQLINYIHNLHSSLRLPFFDSDLENNHPSNSFLIKNDAQQIQTIVFSNLTNFMESTQLTNQFICPPEVPRAITYSLEQDLNNMYVDDYAYHNACAYVGDKRAYNDLLYGDNQEANDFGSAKELSAFIPRSVPEGCKKDNFMIHMQVNPNQIQINPIYESSVPVPFIKGYQESIVLPDMNKQCASYCTSLLNTLCKQIPDFGYCDETIVGSYYKHSTYEARKIPLDFCSCAIHHQDIIESYSYTFTNAVDISKVFLYRNAIYSVKCSN